MIRLIVAFFLAFCGVAHAQSPVLPGPGLPVAAGGGGCSQATAFLARATAVTNPTDQTNYTDLICGLETDGIGCSNTLDALWILAAPDSATYLLNLCSSSFSLTASGTGTFTANQGYASNGSSGFLNTNFVPATNAVFATLNSTSFGVYDRTSRTTNTNAAAFGGRGAATSYSYVILLATTNQIQASINQSTFPFFTTNTNAQGVYSLSRTASGTISAYKNGSSTSLTVSGTQTSVALGNGALYIGALNSNGSTVQYTTDQLAAAWYGAGMTGAQAVLIHTRINNFLTAYGTNVY